jgi:hypothetical protein
MGSKLLSIDDIYFSAEYDPDMDFDIVYRDLVTTLKHDSTKYQRPELNYKNEVIMNGIYVSAAKDAGLKQIIVEGPWDDQYFRLEESSAHNKNTILQNFVFFDDNISKHDKNPMLSFYFDLYLNDCKKKIENTGIIKKGNIETVSKRFFDDNIIAYSLNGKLVSPESKYLLSEPTSELNRRLNTLSPIRSINGQKYFADQK